MDNEEKLSSDLENSIVNLKALMSGSSDLTIKHAKAGGVSICIVFCEGMASTDTMADLIFLPINSIGNSKKLSSEEVLKKIQDELLLAGEQKEAKTYSELMLQIMSGFVAVFIDGIPYAISIGVQGYASRSVSTPATHSNVRSSRDAFVEVIRTNISLVRRRIKSPDMVFKMLTIGDLSHTDVCVCYIKNKADPVLVESIQKRIKDIPLDMILEGGYIQPFLEQKGDAIFSEVGATERPDNFAAKLYDGRVGILVDGTPFALFIPHLFTENFAVVDDYTGRPAYVALMRIFRYIAFISSVILPGFYVALADFNPELFPDTLLLNLAASIQETPYPLLTECLIIHVFFEIMREAGLRMPSNVGHAVSIVGGLVIGDIVVSAGLVGAPLVLIVALSAITSFVVPDLYESIVVMKFTLIIAGGIWGLFGLTIVSALFFMKICSQSPYGIPHTAPVLPFTFKAVRDTVLRFGWRSLAKSDINISKLNGVKISADNGQMEEK